jgi:hypothetical protein
LLWKLKVSRTMVFIIIMFLYWLYFARWLTHSSLVICGMVLFPNWRIGVDEYFDFVVILNMLMIVFD